MRAILASLALLASMASAQVTLSTGSGVVVTLSSGCTSVPAPTFSPAGGPFGAIQSVTISDTTTPSTVYYTIDGSLPSAASILYTGAVSVTSSLTINAIAVAPACSSSLIGQAQYILSIPPTATPTFSPSAGTSPNTFLVTISDLTAGASIYYTLDGSTPTTASTVYSTPLTINTIGETTLKSIAKSVSFAQSGVQSGVFTYQPPTGLTVISPATGPYTGSVSVTITDPCSGASIYYTTNNQAPTTASTLYTGAFTLTSSATVQAIATCALHAQSGVSVTPYTIVQPQQAPTPTFSPPASTYTSTQSVSISDAAPGAQIYYTTNGNPPTTSSTLYSGPITVSATETIKAIATATGFTTSGVGIAAYKIQAGVIVACPQSSANGHLTVNVTNPRNHGASPLMIWNDATGTTDTDLPANLTVSQGVTFTWTFGDSGASGTGVWLYGSNPNKNSTNSATGIVGAHLYRIPDASGDITVRATVTAQDAAGNTVTCLAPVITVNDAAGVNGFGGAATTCVSAPPAATPIAGAGGCPAGATVISSATYTGALTSTFMGSGKRVLFQCGGTFTGNNVTVSGTKWAIGAYGGCAGTQSGRPIFNLAAGGGLTWNATSSNGSFSDIDMEGSGVNVNSGIAMQSGGSGLTYPFEITMNNINVNAINRTFWSFGGHEIALVGVSSQGMGNTDGTFINLSENQCLNGSAAFNCGNGGTTYNPANYASVNYLALMGDLFNGAGASSGGPWEVVRISACDLCVFTNTTFENGFAGGAVFKFHDGNAGSVANAPWTGQPIQFVEISDNLYTGTSGAQIVELTAQNGVTDERLQSVIFERNLINQTANDGVHGCRIWATVQNGTFRDNVFSAPNGSTANFCLELGNRGISGHGSGGSPQFPSWPQYDEAYNNTCYGGACIGLSGATWGAPANNSWAMNNLMFNTGGGAPVTNTGSGNTVSNNTATVTNNPGFVNGSTNFSLITDFIPTANVSGAATVPVFFDALGNPWSSYNLGAITLGASPPTFSFWTQPALNAQGNAYINGGTSPHNVPPCAPGSAATCTGQGVWVMDSVEPVTCAGGNDPSKGFQTTADLSSFTGFSTTNVVSYSSGSAPCTSPQTAASGAQASASTCGAYINGQDVNPAGIGGIHKFGIFCEEWFNPASYTFPMVSYNGIEIGLNMQIPMAIDACSLSSVCQTGDTSNTYSSSDISFVDPNGNKIVWETGIFFNGASHVNTGCEQIFLDGGGSGSYEMKCQLHANAGRFGPYISVASDSAQFQSAPWTGYKYFHYTISQAQFQQALNDIAAAKCGPVGACAPANICPSVTAPTTCFFTDPNVWAIQHYHLNNELHYATLATTQMGWSSNSNFINLF